MPAPQATQIKPAADAALSSAEIKGEAADNLAKALAQATADTLALFMTMAQVMPGIPAAAPAPSGNGSTIGPGMLLAPPAGGPGEALVEPLVIAALTNQGIQGEKAGNLSKVIAGTLVQGISLFITQVQVAPGIPIAGFMTASPGSLT